MRVHRFGVRFPRFAIAVLAAVASMLTVVGLVTWGGAPAQAAPGRAGDVISSQDITSQEDTRLPGGGKVIHMVYLSPNYNGELAETKGTVYIPAAKPRPEGYRIYGYGHGSAGIGDKCTVTDRLGTGKIYDDWLGPWLKDGYVITATEYNGIGTPGQHAYVDGRSAGKNVLDSVRAAKQIVAQYTGEKTSDAYVTGGGSQGGHASIWATALSKSYMPELKNVGGMPSSPAVSTAHFAAVAPNVPPVAIPDYVTYTSFVLAGVKLVHPEVDVDSYLTPLGRKIVRDATELCYPNQSRATKNIALGSLVAKPFSEGPLMSAMRSMMDVPDSGYGAPMLVQQGGLDLFSFLPETEAWANRAIANGADIDLRIYPQAGHGLGPYAEQNGLKWSNARWPQGY